MRLFDFLVKGGPVMVPILVLSVFTLAYALERGVFWFRLLRQHRRTAQTVLETARYDLRDAGAIAEKTPHLAIGRFLSAPLRLSNPTPESFHLALQAAADREFATLRTGDRPLESIIGLALLLGVLGTVTKLMAILTNSQPNPEQAVDMAQVTNAMSNALIPIAGGLVVATLAFIAYRILLSLQARQMDYFSKIGSELELIYRQVWHEPSLRLSSRLPGDVSAASVDH
jgi:biopolymer transport protein ExbB